MENIKTTTPKGREGFNISYSSEMNFGKELLKVLPKGWKVSLSWLQILFSDVQYEIDFKKKLIEIAYNRNLLHWKNTVVKEILYKIEQNKFKSHNTKKEG